jgi:hypothetical protein
MREYHGFRLADGKKGLDLRTFVSEVARGALGLGCDPLAILSRHLLAQPGTAHGIGATQNSSTGNLLEIGAGSTPGDETKEDQQLKLCPSRSL